MRPPATIDHVPARAFFRGRQWPEGYEFAVCEECNNETRIDELIFSALARTMPEPKDESESREWQHLIEGMSRNHQQAFLELWQDNHRIQSTVRPMELGTSALSSIHAWSDTQSS
jgi:hypothetical protein